MENRTSAGLTVSDVRRRRVAATAVVVAATLALAGVVTSAPAGAVNSDPEYTGNSTTTVAAKPDLTIGTAGTVSHQRGSTSWSVTYTVTNRGSATSPASKVGIGPRASTNINLYRSVPSLAKGASFTDSFTWSATGCWLALRAVADPGNAVAEVSEVNNAYAMAGGDGDCTTAPRYQVKLVSLKAVDETNDDWKGSDEPYVIWAGWLPYEDVYPARFHPRHSREFDDVDTGESRAFAADDGCVWAPCGGGRAARTGMSFNLSIWESDLEDHAEIEELLRQACLNGGSECYAKAFARADEQASDQRIGDSTYYFTRNNLAWYLPNLSSSYTPTRRLSGGPNAGGGVYDITINITRSS